MDIGKNDLADNPTARVPVCVLLDTSESMIGEPIEELNKGVRSFVEELKNDEMTLYSADVCVITFGGYDVELVSDFGPVDDISLRDFVASGMTPMGSAVEMALDLLSNRKEEYKDQMIPYHQPWVVLMTDGQPNDRWQDAAIKLSDLANNKKVVIFPVGIGDDANMDVLRQFSPRREPLKLKGLKFQPFFEWLSASISATSQSIPGEKVPLPGVSTWSEL